MQRLLLPLLAVTALACSAPKPEAKAPVAAKPVVQPAAPTTTAAAVAAPPKAPVIPEEITALVVEVKKCKFGQDGFDFQCEALKDWENEEDAFADGQGDEALLTMLASTDAKDRFLAADRLATFTGTVLSEEHAADVEIIDRILTAAAKEKKSVIATRLADVVVHLDLVGTDRLARAVEIAKTHRLDDYRREFALMAGFSSQSRGEELLAWGEELSTNGNHDLARYVIARHTHDDDLADRACKNLSALRSDAALASSLMMDLAAAPACRSFHDGIVKDIAALDLGKTEGPHTRLGAPIALQSICADTDTTKALKTKALAQAKRLTDSKNVPSYVRGSALSAVASCDAKTGALYASKFAKDKDLGTTAKWISARSAKK